MKFKSVISGILAFSMVLGTTAFAEALRRDPKIKIPERPTKQANDIFFDDFSAVALGTRPSFVRSNGNNGTLLTEVYEVAPGLKKNCFEITDLADSGGPQAIIDLPDPTGIVSAEFRYKYISTGDQWSAFRVDLYDTTNHRYTTVAVNSGDGKTYYNLGGTDSTNLENAPVSNDTWYLLRLTTDFNNQLVSVSLTNEGTGKTVNFGEKVFRDGDIASQLKQIRITSVNYTGKIICDYIKVAKEKEMPEFAEIEIKKGVDGPKTLGAVNHAVPGRININIDGTYKYLSAAPYISENGNVMVSVKNIANMFNMRYLRMGSVFTIKDDKNSYTFNSGEAKFNSNKNSINLPEASKQINYQLFVPIVPVVESLGYEISYDTESTCVNIVTPSENGGE